ncbi:MAG: hypothetical protein DWC03_05395 [Candidatus Poseidoniales archaeon]|nr:MAG: hypothetical protein DWC03_05395 [Candidatus Poseidoniales archaeon]
MGTRLHSLALLLSLLLLAAPLAAAAPPSGGDSNTVSSSETWTEDAHMNGHVVVANGATLTINANITMETGSSITVEDGGQLVVTNGALVSDDLNAGLMVNSMFATLTLNFGDLADDGVLQLKFNHAIDSNSKMDVTLGDETINASGQDMVQFDAPLNNTDLVVTFDSYYFTPTYVLWAKAIYGGGNTETLLAQDIDAADAPLYWFQSGFDIHAHGDLTVTSSTISGANIHCESLCQFDNAELVGSAPIEAASTSSVAVLNSIISGSRSDEDIILYGQAQITYTNSQGTGGTTDAWVRLLPQRSLSTNIPNGSLDIYDIGYKANDWNDLTDENGNIVFVESGATNEWKRMIEWMDGDGVVQQEDATITLSISSSWGTYSKTIDAPTTAEGSIELDLPYVAVTSVNPEANTAVANKSISGMVTVSNTGNADVAGVNIWCYNGDEIVETTQMVVSLTAGESKDVPFTWYMYEAGDASLTCKPLLPSALNGIADLVVDATGAESAVVSWEYQEEIEEFPFIIWIVAIVGFMGLALVISSQTRKQAEAKSYTLHEEDHVVDSTEDDDDSETHDDGGEEEDDDEEASEEMEEDSTSSIYDLQPENED